MELTNEDKQRIKQASDKHVGNGMSIHDDRFISGAEYATKYEREQQLDLYLLIENRKNRLVGEATKRGSIGFETQDQINFLETILTKIRVEAERTELRNENEYLKQLLKRAADMLPAYVGPPEKPEINKPSEELYYLIQDAI